MRADMERALLSRHIDKLYHFTRAENLPSIFAHGLLPRSVITEKGIKSCFNDEYRYDQCTNAVCLSIEFPNYKMFYKLRQDNPDVVWAVLELDAHILCSFSCAYCWTNAGDASMFNTPIRDRMGITAFLKLFENRPHYPQREELRIMDSFPTNPQAEVLVFDRIPVSFIRSVYFENAHLFEEYRTVIPQEVQATYDLSYFRYRSDWKSWKRQEDT